MAMIMMIMMMIMMIIIIIMIMIMMMMINDDVSPLSSRTVGEAGVCWGEVEVQILDGVVC